MKKLTILIIILGVNLILFSIEWIQEFHDSAGDPIYTGGFTSSSPTFADIDADGDYDCFIGSRDRDNSTGASIFFLKIQGLQKAVNGILLQKLIMISQWNISLK